jgi:predicted ATPase
LPEAAPEVRVLVTSRESLRLQEEWIYPLAGLGVPRGEAPAPRASGAPDGDDALLLFERCARRVRAGFDLEAERTRVVRVCRAVDGNPLAIELAAGWLRTLPLDEIERELERGIGILASRHRDVPERQRSMRAVLEASWRLLGDEEQRVLARLSVFRGTFRRADAERVAGASLPILATLVEKSLLEALGTGRYGLHELLRHFAAERLAGDTQDEVATRGGHSGHHLGLLGRLAPLLDGAEQRRALDEIAASLDDVEAAWAWALDRGDVGALDEALAVAADVYRLLGRPQRGTALVEGLRSELERTWAVRTPEGEALHARALVHQGWFSYLLGRYEVAEASVSLALERSLPAHRFADVALAHLVAGMVAAWQGREKLAEERMLRSLALGEAIADAKSQALSLRELSLLHASYGDYPRGRELGRRGLALARELGRPDLIALLLDVLVWPNACLGAYDEAEACGRQGLAILERSGNRWGVAQVLGSLGWVDFCRGRLEEARTNLERGLVVAREVGARLSIANLLGDLAFVENARGDPERAQELTREGLEIARELDSPMYVAYHLTALGGAVAALGAFAEARRHLLAAVRLTHEARLEPQCLMALCDLAAVELAHARAVDRPGGRPYSDARALLEIVAEHPKTWAVVRARAGELAASLPPASARSARGGADGEPATLGAVVAALLRDGGEDGSSLEAP